MAHKDLNFSIDIFILVFRHPLKVSLSSGHLLTLSLLGHSLNGPEKVKVTPYKASEDACLQIIMHFFIIHFHAEPGGDF